METTNNLPIIMQNIRWFFIFSVTFQILSFYGIMQLGTKLVKWLRRRGRDRNQHSIIWMHVVKIIFVIHLILYLFNELNLKLNSFESMIALLFTVAVLLLNKTFLSNMVYSLWILFDKSFKIGSAIEFTNISGVIKEINLINFAIETYEGDKIYIPYKNLYKQEHKINQIKSGYLLEIKIKAPTAIDTNILFNLCLVNPFRKGDSKVEVIKNRVDQDLYVTVKFYTWSNTVVGQAKELFLSQCTQYLETLNAH